MLVSFTAVRLVALTFTHLNRHTHDTTRQFMDHKGFCEDITEGKFSFPIIHSIRAVPHDHRLLSILKQRTNGIALLFLDQLFRCCWVSSVVSSLRLGVRVDVELKKYAVKYMEQTGSFEYTRNILKVPRACILRPVSRVAHTHTRSAAHHTRAN
jgi:geranylgeranyl diphosphate synthase type 3